MVHVFRVYCDYLSNFSTCADCGPPNAVDGYIIDLNASPTTSGSTANVSGCAVGYKGAPNQDEIQCAPDGQWSVPKGCQLLGKFYQLFNRHFDHFHIILLLLSPIMVIITVVLF